MSQIFSGLSDKITGTIKSLRGQSRLSEENINDAIKTIRLSLLEADVNFKVVKSFIDAVKEQALGDSVLKGVSPGQQFVKIVFEELKKVLGGETADLNTKSTLEKPASIMLVGLQGAGKTTTAAKLALHIRNKVKKKPGLVPLDLQRPAAVAQLQTLGKNLSVPTFQTDLNVSAEANFKKVAQWARENMVEVLILDTAGRSQIDSQLMGELASLKDLSQPGEILLVADAMLGQQSVAVAEGFNAEMGLTGLILTKVDGDARGGAALSIRYAVGVPIKFLGVGEKTDALEVFHPERLASRILDMGDVVSLVEKAQEVIDEKTAKDAMTKMAKNQFTVEDFLAQMQMLKKMGGIGSLLGHLPGMGQALKQVGEGLPEAELKKTEAIIRSMTKEERRDHRILNGSRRSRIANGSGTHVSEVNRFIKQFEQSQKMMSMMMKGGLGSMMRGMGGLGGGFPGMKPPRR